MPELKQWEGQQVSCEGSVCGIEYKKGIQYLYLNDLKIDFMQEISCRYRIQVIMKETADVSYGNRVCVRGKLLPAEEPTNDGQFDTLAWQKMERILFTLKYAGVSRLDGHVDRFSQFLFCARRCGQNSLARIFNEEDAGVLGAMLLGETAGVSPDIRSWYQMGGISHVLAISGLHISLIGMAVYRTLRKKGFFFWGCAALSGVLMVLYAVFTGAGTATCRAVIMFLAFLGAQCLGRTYDLLSALSLAVILLLLSEPLLLFSVDFQLSVLAVVSVERIGSVLKKYPGTRAFTGLGIQLGLLPCILWHYYTFSLYGMIINLAVLPALPLVLAGGGAALCLGLFCERAAKLIQIPVHVILLIYRLLCQTVSLLPLSQIRTGRPEGLAVAVYYCVLFTGIWIMSKERGNCQKGKKAFPFFLIFAMLMLPVKRTRGLSLAFLDVGQGDAIFMQSEDGTTILCDGGSSSVGNVGQYRILPFLKYHGIETLDYLFLTHMDADHINGIREILESEIQEVQIGTLILPDIPNPDDTYRTMEMLAGKRGAEIQKMHAGDRLRAGKLTLTCLHPSADFETEQENENSLVLHAAYGSFDALFMGDLEKEGEKYLISSGWLGQIRDEGNQIEVLKAGHHGSKGASSEDFLKMVNPMLAVLSYGKGNRYGHPAPETIDRLTQAGCGLLTTENCGEIMIFCDKNEKITIRFGKNVIK